MTSASRTSDSPTPNRDFFARAFGNQGPKVWNGFSRPVYHNVMGMLHGHKFSKMGYGGMIRHTEAAMLTKWASEIPEGGNIVEIGCYGGLSTSYLYLGASRRNGMIYSIDPFDSDFDKQADLTDHAVALDNKPARSVVRQRLDDLGAGDRVELIEGYSQEVVKDWKHPIDFLWIDGNHDQAWQDYLDWAPFLKPHARVGLHDAHPRYGIPKVAEDAQKIFSTDEWDHLEHVKSIITGLRKS